MVKIALACEPKQSGVKHLVQAHEAIKRVIVADEGTLSLEDSFELHQTLVLKALAEPLDHLHLKRSAQKLHLVYFRNLNRRDLGS
jgi:hypothetical protein